MYQSIQHLPGVLIKLCYRAISAVYVVASPYERSCFHAVAYVELTRTEKAEKEKIWKRDDLGQRLDNFTPWGMK